MRPGIVSRPHRGAGLVGVVLALALLLGLGALLYLGLDHLIDTWGSVPLNITIDGEPVAEGVQLGMLTEGHRLTLVATVLTVLLVLALLLPVVIVLALVIALGLALVLTAVAIGTPVLAVGVAVGVVALLVALPVLLLARLLRWLLRDPPRPPQRAALPAPSARIDS